MTSYQARYLSPMIPTYNMTGTASFFKDLFHFQPVMESETYTILIKDSVTIHLLRAGPDIGQMEFYLEVDGVDALWASIKDKLAGIHVREPFNRQYGMREFHVAVPHTKALMFVGQEIT